jgi:propionyl-CoA synthetase
MPLAFVVPKDMSLVEKQDQAGIQAKEIMKKVDESLGAIARPRNVHFVSMLPKTRSGKLLRRSIQAIAEGKSPGDLTTLEDPAAIDQIKNAVSG